MIEPVILSGLLHNEDFVRRTLPYIKSEYFSEPHYAAVFTQIEAFVTRYNKAPSQDELLVDLTERGDMSQEVYDNSVDLVSSLCKKSKEPAIDWLIENTEKFCQDRSLYNAIVDAVAVVENGDQGSILKSAIPDMLRDALAVSFDHAIGHDFSDYESRFNALRENEAYRIPFDVPVFNDVTGGGLPRKTLSVISAMTGAGKTLFLCHYAARCFLAGYKVLYITMEMAEERISERIDANLLNLDLSALAKLSKDEYGTKIRNVLDTCDGRMIVKEYPTASAGTGQFRSLMNELKMKKDFTPDIVIVDYINICTSSRFKAASVNSYQYVKAICEELRGLAIEFDVACVSATQLNRSAIESSDVGLGEISESHGLAMTVDLLWVMIRSEELDGQNLVLFKQLKNRFNDMSRMLRFAVGIDRAKMKLFDADQASVKTYGDNIMANGSPAPNATNSVVVDTVKGAKKFSNLIV